MPKDILNERVDFLEHQVGALTLLVMSIVEFLKFNAAHQTGDPGIEPPEFPLAKDLES